MLQAELNNKGPYTVSISAMHLRLQELQETKSGAHEIRTTQLQIGWKKVNGIFYYQALLYISEIIHFELIVRHYDNLLASHFRVNKTGELISQKYYWLSLRKDIESYMRGYDDYLALKAVRHKSYSSFQFLLVLTY